MTRVRTFCGRRLLQNPGLQPEIRLLGHRPGGFIGTEYVRHPDKEYNFIIGPKLETELEVFILPRTALLAAYNNIGIPYPLTSGTLSGT